MDFYMVFLAVVCILSTGVAMHGRSVCL